MIYIPFRAESVVFQVTKYTYYNYPLLMCIAAYNVYYTYPPPHPPP